MHPVPLYSENFPLQSTSQSVRRKDCSLLLHTLNRCQTYAFTVLGLSQLFHAVGMRDVETSVFRMNHWKNKMMLAAAALGVGLQLMVTEIPYFVGVFGTSSLAAGEWAFLTALSAAPLLVHEILAVFLKDRA